MVAFGWVGQQQNQKPIKIRSTINITIAVSFRMRRRPAGKTAKEGLFVVLCYEDDCKEHKGKDSSSAKGISNLNDLKWFARVVAPNRASTQS